MRVLINKRNFTKAERRFVRILQENHIPFKAKVKIRGREIDFLIGKYAIDVDGHEQDSDKNQILLGAGYIPLHLENKETKSRNKLNQLTKCL